MANINKVLIMGRLGKDPELRYTTTQKPVCTLTVATSEFYIDQSGQKQENTEWHRVIVWGKQAESCGKYLNKGRGVFIEGSIHTRSWEDQQGQKRYSTEIKARNVQFLPQSSPSAENTSSGYSQYQPAGAHADTDNGGGFPPSAPAPQNPGYQASGPGYGSYSAPMQGGSKDPHQEAPSANTPPLETPLPVIEEGDHAGSPGSSEVPF